MRNEILFGTARPGFRIPSAAKEVAPCCSSFQSNPSLAVIKTCRDYFMKRRDKTFIRRKETRRHVEKKKKRAEIQKKKPTCGFTSTRSIKSTTKSCSTYLSANRLHRGHCVSRTSPPAPAPALAPCGVLTFAAIFAASSSLPASRPANVEKDEGDVTAAAGVKEGGVGGEIEEGVVVVLA